MEANGPPDWDGLAARFQAEAARPGHAPAPVAGLDVGQTARVLTVVAGQWGRYAPPAPPALPALASTPPNRLPWVPLARRGLEREAFAVLPRAWRPVLATRLIEVYGFHPHPDAWLPHAEDTGLHPDLWRFAGPGPQDVDSALFASWTSDAMEAALERWDAEDKAAADDLRGAVWNEAGARQKARLLDMADEAVEAWCEDVRALALDAKTGVELRRAARRALSRWDMWEADWPLTEDEQEAVVACTAPATGLMGRLLGRPKPKGGGHVLEPSRVPYAALSLAKVEMPAVVDWAESDWWALLVGSAPRALLAKGCPRVPHTSAVFAIASLLHKIPFAQRAAVWADLCAHADPLQLLPALAKPCGGLPMWARGDWDTLWQAWRSAGTPPSVALSSLFLPAPALAAWRKLPADWSPITQHRHAAVANLLSSLQGEAR